ncbi:MAG: TonB-dependent receptor, partial [Acidobacteria bacterium]|nr:TonB-dependent receptor [Acidobacteriota bacterium]
FDLRNGPPEGRDRDRAASAIKWIESDFCRRLRAILSPGQLQVLNDLPCSGRGADQIAHVRINNNPVTAEAGFGAAQPEPGGFRRGVGTDIIERGGQGNFHGAVNTLFNDEALNARNPFQQLKPAFQEQEFAGSFSGPVVRDRLTADFFANRHSSENSVGLYAFTPSGFVTERIIQPRSSYNVRSLLHSQVTNRQSVHADLRFGNTSEKGIGVGGITLPERGLARSVRTAAMNLRQIFSFSERTVYENVFSYRHDGSAMRPEVDAVAIDVMDAFQAGGAQTRTSSLVRRFEFGNQLFRSGHRASLKTGLQGSYERYRSTSEKNIHGTFVFSNLDEYIAGRPLVFQTGTAQSSAFHQTKLAGFVQNDVNVTGEFRLMMGARYEYQSQLKDANNVDPRIGIAYAVATSTVIRAGVGVFHHRAEDAIVQLPRRASPVLYPMGIIHPSYPNPFPFGSLISIRVMPRSRRDDLAAPYNINTSISVERSFPGGLLVFAAFDHERSVHLYRTRNVNAPLLETYERPDRSIGNVFTVESSGRASVRRLRIGVRQRMSRIHAAGHYTLSSAYNSADDPFILPSNNYDLEADWGRMPSVRKHELFSAFNARLPFDISLMTGITAKSGAPYNITTGYDDNADASTNDRPHGVPRNSATGPAFFNTDFRVTKSFFFDDSRNTQVNVFANLYNALNRPNYGTPVGVMNSMLYGKPTIVLNPRRIDVGVRFQF